MELVERFERVDETYGPVPIWWWSGAPLRRDRLRWQMEQLRSQGVSQAVIMCLAPRGPLFGALADDPPFLSEAWWDIFLGACEDAHDIGFRFWLYDQLGFSGANFQGQVVTAHPEYAGWELARLVVESAGGRATLATPPGGQPVAAYAVPAGGEPTPVPLTGGVATWNGGPARLCLVYTVRRGFDYHHPDAGATLIDLVLGEFARRAQQWFGSVIVGLFQDELPTMPSWSGAFAESFRQAYGYDLRAEIAHLWEEAGPRGQTVRRDFHALRATLATRAFFQPLAQWANRWGLTAGFDQQSPAREGDPTGGVALYGDYLATHSGFTAPGSDHWGDPKVHSSLAHAGRQPRTWLEAFHSSGWGGTLEETYDWLGPFLRRGANLYDPHAVYYATVGGWFEWAPPSTCWRQPYWDTYRSFADPVTRMCSLLSAGSLVCDTILVHPTLTVQANLTLDGALPDARSASAVYHALNGATSWFSEQPGVLDRAGLDYEVFDEATLAGARVTDGELRVADGAFRNVVLPRVSVLDSPTAAVLTGFAAAGGRVVCVGAAPSVILGDAGGVLATALREAVRAGRISVVAGPDDVPAALARGPISVRADAPFMLRRYGDALVLIFVAHDDRTGTQAPILPGHRNLNWVEETFRWDRYWTELGERGYTFVPVGDRRISAELTGVSNPGIRAQRWDPRSGARVELPVRTDGELTHLDLGFDDGAMAVVVLAPDLPAATAADPGRPIDVTPLDGVWEIEARSTADNRWGDLAGAVHSGVVPLQVWRFEHAVGGTDGLPAGSWQPVHAGFGPYVEIQPPQEAAAPGVPDGWLPGGYSLSHGIRKDPLHFEYLGPKGMVPEEFLAWPDAGAGQWVAFRTHLDLPDGTGRWLSVGANAHRLVRLDGAPQRVHGTGYWTLTDVPDGERRIAVEVWLRAEGPHDPASPGPTTGVRASFAVVADRSAYRRPEWLVPADGTRPGTTVDVSRVWTLERAPTRAVLQVAAEGPCTVLVNGQEVGRQGDFDPYAALRTVRVQPYDLTGALRTGTNVVTFRLPDGGRRVSVLADNGSDLVTDASWTATRDGRPVGLELRREQWTDPRWVCLRPRPHPLPRAAWLDPTVAADGAVLDVVPTAGDAEPSTQWLRFAAPAGMHEFTVATPLPFSVVIAGAHLTPVAGRVTLPAPLPGGTPVTLRFDDAQGRRGGSLVEGPVEARLGAVAAELAPWADLGLRSLAGSVTYRRRVRLPSISDSDRMILDLGAVRGTSEVRVNGVRAGAAVFSPYRVELTGLLHEGDNEIEIIVRGTLAGYLDDVSPTPAIAAGQTHTGLFGPVRLQRHVASGSTDRSAADRDHPESTAIAGSARLE
ncbi:MAG TPA: hypothetical protein VK453_04115 [Micromonosporaceae bacterium]|nr:hypothetical protein [Micromonosporaceae bacterium]